MTQNFIDSFNSLANVDSNNTNALADTFTGVVSSGQEFLAPLELISAVSQNISLGPSIFDKSRNLIYVIAYNQSPDTVLLYRYDLLKKVYKEPIVLSFVDTVTKLIVSPDFSTLFIVCNNSGVIKRINLTNFTDISNTLSLSNIKDIIFSANQQDSYLAADKLYKVNTQELCNALDPELIPYFTGEILDFNIDSNQKIVGFIDKQALSPTTVKYNIGYLDIWANTVNIFEIYSGPANLATTINPTGILVTSDYIFTLGNSFSSSKLIKLDIINQLILDISIPPGNIDNNVLKDIKEYNNLIYVSHGTTIPNNLSLSNNKIFVLDFNLNILDEIILPKSQNAGQILILDNCLYNFPISGNNFVISRYLLSQSKFIENLEINTVLFNNEPPKLANNYFYFTNFLGVNNSLVIINANKKLTKFGTGSKVLIIDGINELSCLENGNIIPGGPFNETNPFIISSTDEYSEIYLQNNAVLTYDDNIEPYLQLLVSKVISIDVTSKISANYLGFYGGEGALIDDLGFIQKTASNGQGKGAGLAGITGSPISTYSGFGGSGAGHSLPGGDSFQKLGGVEVGNNLFDLIEIGPGGGGGNIKGNIPFCTGGRGGRGGGSIILSSPRIIIDGTIEAKGEDGKDGINYGGGGGAGAGGSVYLNAINLLGSSVKAIDVSGGIGGKSLGVSTPILDTSLSDGGYGSPGRILLNIQNDSSTTIGTSLGSILVNEINYIQESQLQTQVVDVFEDAPVDYQNFIVNATNSKGKTRSDISVLPNQSLINLPTNIDFLGTNLTYNPNQNELLLFIDGELTSDYTELNSTQIQLTNPKTYNTNLSVLSLSNTNSYFDNPLNFTKEIVAPTQEGLDYYLNLNNSFNPQYKNIFIFKNNQYLHEINYLEINNTKIKLYNTPDNSDEFTVYTVNKERINKKNIVITQPVREINNFSYLINSGNLLVFKNGLLLSESEYFQSGNTLKFNNNFETGDNVTLVELKLSNISVELSDALTENSNFIFNKKEIKQLNKRFFKYKINFRASKTSSALVSQTEMQIINSSEKGYIDLRIKDQTTASTRLCQPEWVSFNLEDTQLSIIPLNPLDVDKFIISFENLPGLSSKTIQKFLANTPIIETETAYKSNLFNDHTFKKVSGPDALIFIDGELKNSTEYSLNGNQITFTNTQQPNYISAIQYDNSILSVNTVIGTNPVTSATNDYFILVFKNGQLINQYIDYVLNPGIDIVVQNLQPTDIITVITTNNSSSTLCYKEEIPALNEFEITLFGPNLGGQYFANNKNHLLFNNGYFVDFNFGYDLKQIVNSSLTLPVLPIGKLDLYIEQNCDFIFEGTLVSNSNTIDSKTISYTAIDQDLSELVIQKNKISINPFQEIVELTNHYAPNTNNILVFQNGLLLNQVTDFDQNSTKTIKLLNPPNISSEIVVYILPTVKSFSYENFEILTNSNSLDINTTSDNLLIYLNGKLLREKIDYTKLGSTITTALVAGDNVVVLKFNENIVKIKNTAREITNLYQKDIIDTTIGFNLNTNVLQVYRNQLLFDQINYEETESFSILLNNLESKNDIISLVYLDFIQGNISNNPEGLIFDHELANPVSKLEAVGFIREDKNILEVPVSNEVVLERIQINPQDKTLLFQNGILLTKDIDYTKNTEINFTLINPLSSPSNIELITTVTQERIDFVITDNLITSYDVILPSKLNNNILVFKNGQLLNQDLDYLQTESTYDFLCELNISDNISLIRFDATDFNNQTFTPFSLSPTILLSQLYRALSGELLVFRNGILLKPTDDYTENQGNSITLLINSLQIGESDSQLSISDIYNFVLIRNATQKNERTSLVLNSLDSNIIFSTNYNLSTQNTLVFKNENSNTFERAILNREEQFASDLQQLFTINNFSYTTGDNSLIVFTNGVLQLNGTDYTEVDSNNVTFNLPKQLNDKISFIKLDTNISLVEYVNAVDGSDTITFSSLSYNSDNPDELTIFKNGLLQIKGIHYNQLSSNVIQFSDLFTSGDIIVGIDSKFIGLEYDNLLPNNTNFTSANTNFVTEQDNILVFRNGILQVLNIDYNIVNNQSINFIQPSPNTTTVAIVGLLNSAILSSKLKLLSYGQDYIESVDKIIFNNLNQGDKFSVIQFTSGIVSTKETYTALGGEDLITFTNFSHCPTQQKLFVFKNGFLQTFSDYFEIDNTSIKFNVSLSTNDKIEFIHLSPTNLLLNVEQSVATSPTNTYTLKSFAHTSAQPLLFKNKNLITNNDYSLVNDFNIVFTNPLNINDSILALGSTIGSIEQINGSNTTNVLLTNISYVPNANQIIVFKNSILQTKGVDYQESTPTLLIFNSNVSNSDIVTVFKSTQILRKDIVVTDTNNIINNTDFGSSQYVIIKNNNELLLPNIDYVQLGLNGISLFANPVIGDLYTFIDLTNKSIPLSASFLQEDFDILSPQTIFSLNNFNYVSGNNSLLVFGNNRLYTTNQDYIETATNIFTLTSPGIPGQTLNTFGISASSDAISSTISIRNFEYEPNKNELLVYLNGQLLLKNLQYDEINNKALEFNLDIKEVVFKNGILLTRLNDYTKDGIQKFNFIDQVEPDDLLETIYCKTTGFFVNTFEVTDENQLTYSLIFSYLPNAADLLVFKNGIYQIPNIDYIESSNNEITFFSNDLETGDLISCYRISSIGSANIDHQSSTLNQTTFTLPFTYNSLRLLVFREGILQSAGIDYNEPASNSVSFIEPLQDQENVTFVSLNTTETLFRSNTLITEASNSFVTSEDLTSITEQPLTLTSLINLFKIDQDNIERVDVTAPDPLYFAYANISNPENTLVFKNNILLRPNNEFKVFDSGVFLVDKLQTSDILSVLSFNSKLKFDYEEIITNPNQTNFKFNIPLRNNTFDYWLYLNGKLLTKDVDYIEIDTHNIKLTGAAAIAGNIISLISFRENNQTQFNNIIFDSPAISGNYIKAIDFSDLNEKVLDLANLYGLKLNKNYIQPNQGDYIKSDLILDSKNILKYISRRENSISNFSQVDDEFFVSDPINSNNINSLINIVNETANAAPNSNNFCIPTAEKQTAKLTAPNSVTGIISRITNNPFILFREEQVSGANQTIFNINTFSYVQNTGELLVFVNGVLNTNTNPFNDYTETDPTTITFSNGLPENSSVTFVKLNSALFVKDQNNNPTIGTNILTITNYNTNNNEIFPFRNGLLQDLNPLLPDNSFQEISSTQIQMAPSFVADETITSFIWPVTDYERFVTTSGQTTISTNIYDFSVLGNKALVFRNGQLQIPNIDYTISGSKTLSFDSNKLYDNDIIIILGDQIVKFIYESIFSSFNSVLDLELDQETLGYYIDSESFTAS